MSGGSEREQIGQRIRSLRKARDFSIQRLAEAAGISAGYLSDVERGFSAPSGEKLVRIAAELGVTTDYLLTGQTEQAKNGDQAAVSFPAALAAVAEKFNLSYVDAKRLLDGKLSLVARRATSAVDDDWTVEKWIDFYKKVKHLL